MVDMTAIDFDSASGVQVAEEAAASGGKFVRIKTLTMGDGDSVYVRLISDHTHVLTMNRHFSPTREKPADHEGNWPKSMPAICRCSPAFQKAGTYPDCILCIKHAETKDDRNYKPATKTFGLAVVRIPLMHEGRQVGLQDSMVEMEIDGQKTKVPEVVWMEFSWGNMWANMNGYLVDYGTWCDRDYRITRTGDDKDTEYRPVPVNPLTVDGYDHTALRLQRAEMIEAGTPADQLPQEPGDPFDTRNPDHFARYLPTLQTTPEELKEKYGNDPQALAKAKTIEMVMERSSDEYYARFFDDRVPHPPRKKKGEDGGQPAQETPPPVQQSSGPDADELDALAQRIQGYDGPSANQAPAPPAPPTMAEPEPATA